MTTLGAIFHPQLPPELLRETVQAADESGLSELWLWEDCFFEGGISMAAAALAWSERVRVGVGVMPVPLRNVALHSMEIAALERLFPGRFILALGHGVQSWMGQAGVRAASPMTLLREYVGATRELLAGERVSASGRYVNLDDVVLTWPPAAPPSLLLGGRGERTLRLSGELADGTVLDAAAARPDGVRQALAAINEGRAEGGRTDAHQVIAFLPAGAGPSATAEVRADVAEFGDVPIPEYESGVTAETVAAAVRNLAAAGADTVVLQPPLKETDPAGFVRFVTDVVRPLVEN